MAVKGGNRGNESCCLVTGGAGFIGSHLVEGALAEGWRVKVFDDLSSGSLENLSGVADRIEFIQGDVRDAEALKKAASGAEVIFHLAALVSVELSFQDPILSAGINDIGTLNVFEAARRNGTRRVVFSSSAAVYGNTAAVPNDESSSPDPLSPYALHKHSGECYGRIFNLRHGLEAVSLRYFNVYGPRQNPDSPYSGVISVFSRKLATGETPVIFGDGEQTRDFIYVGDVVRANLLASVAAGVSCSVFNAGTGVSTSILGLLNAMASIKGARVSAVYGEERVGEVRHSLASTELAREKLGFSSRTGLNEGLARTMEWMSGRGPDG